MKSLALLLSAAFVLSLSACGTCPKSAKKAGAACCGTTECSPADGCPVTTSKTKPKKH